MKIRSTISILLLAVCQNGWAQGFTNLNFEDATVTFAGGPALIYASNAIPGWSAYIGPTNNPTSGSSSGLWIIGYNGLSLGGAIVALQDTNAITYGPIEGNYGVLLQGSTLLAVTTASIGQTGTIPVSAQSLTFFAIQGGLQIAFNNQTLSFVAISNALNYTVYGADISPFAGQTGQLLFTVPVQGIALLDNIQFSSIPIPEPSEFALAVLGVLTLGFHFRRNRPS